MYMAKHSPWIKHVMATRKSMANGTKFKEVLKAAAKTWKGASGSSAKPATKKAKRSRRRSTRKVKKGKKKSKSRRRRRRKSRKGGDDPDKANH